MGEYAPTTRGTQTEMRSELSPFKFPRPPESFKETFQRMRQSYNQLCNAQLSDAIRIGLIEVQLGDHGVRDHRQLNGSRMDTWNASTNEVREVVRGHRDLVVLERVGAACKPLAATQEPIAGAIPKIVVEFFVGVVAHAKRSASDKSIRNWAYFHVGQCDRPQRKLKRSSNM